MIYILGMRSIYILFIMYSIENMPFRLDLPSCAIFKALMHHIEHEKIRFNFEKLNVKFNSCNIQMI